MVKIGVIGAEEYTNKGFVIKKLYDIVRIEIDIVVSGHSPANNYNNVDIWAENWAEQNCWIKPIIFPAKKPFTRERFFHRNKKIALEVRKLISFINKGLYKSGAWNTIGYFVSRPNFNYSDLIIYNEFGKLWKHDELPKWVKNKV